MKIKGNLLLPLFLLMSLTGMAQQPARTGKEIPESFCLSQLEYKLYRMINDYRLRYDLPAIPLSKSLCYVASTHMKDLFFNHPDAEPCNLHSWSDKGNWKPFCYPKDETKKSSVWDKPKELTNYKGKGYEIVYWENNPVTIDSVIAFWKSIPYFNSFLLNTGKWQEKKWNAIGIGIYENYACAWFGELPDAEAIPYVCGQEPEKKTTEVKEEKPVPGVKEQGTVKETKPVKKPDPPKTEPSLPSEGTFYIIVKSQFPMAVMQKSLEELKTAGYAEAKILEKDSKVRLSILEFHIKASADSALREVRKNYKDAWILKY